jgi:tubulin polyglutamylase TTLL5
MKKDKRYYWLGHDTPSKQDTFFIEALDSTLWAPGNENQWDTCWFTGMPEKNTFEQLTPEKTINHIPGNNALTIKSNLYDTLVESRQHANTPEQLKRYNFFPETYSMPEDYFKFQEEAMKNPQQLWIQKPRNLSRGRGIEMVKHPAAVPFDPEWIIQKYIANPHLYDNHKYVLRCYVLITSVEPLRFYWYQEGFAKLASETYSEEDLDNPYRHLTNPDINEDNTEAETPVTFFSFKKYREWLRDQGHDDEALFNALKDLITLTVIAAREKMRRQSEGIEANTQGCYELIGLDCMVDNDLKPWILECNLSPSLDTYANSNAGADDEVNIKRQLVKDLVNILGLNTNQQQPLSTLEKASMEKTNTGNFECLFPSEKANEYLNCFPVPRYADIASLEPDTEINTDKLVLQPKEENEYLFDDSLAIYTESKDKSKGTFFTPNETALWIWLKNTEGHSPLEIIDELKTVIQKPVEINESDFHKEISKQVWDVLSDWSHSGIFQKTSPSQIGNTKSNESKYRESAIIQIASAHITLNITCSAAIEYLTPLISSIQKTNTEEKTIQPESTMTIDILKSSYGYQIISGITIIAENLKLAELAPAILHACFNNENLNISNTLEMVAMKKDNTVFLVADNKKERLNSIAYQLAETEGFEIISGFVTLSNNGKQLFSTGLPIKTPEIAELTYEDGTRVFCQSNSFSYYYVPTNTPPQEISIEALIFLDCEEDELISLKNLTSAEAIMNSWQFHTSKKSSYANQLASWIKNMQAIKIHLPVEQEYKIHHVATQIDLALETIHNKEREIA